MVVMVVVEMEMMMMEMVVVDGGGGDGGDSCDLHACCSVERIFLDCHEILIHDRTNIL